MSVALSDDCRTDEDDGDDGSSCVRGCFLWKNLDVIVGNDWWDTRI